MCVHFLCELLHCHVDSNGVVSVVVVYVFPVDMATFISSYIVDVRNVGPLLDGWPAGSASLDDERS